MSKNVINFPGFKLNSLPTNPKSLSGEYKKGVVLWLKYSFQAYLIFAKCSSHRVIFCGYEYPVKSIPGDISRFRSIITAKTK